MTAISVLVVDDEPLARRKLAALLEDVPWAVHVGEAADGASALDAIDRLRPDVVFLDIQMPELTGLQVVERLRRLESAPVVIFTTAYDRHAVAAFELEAVDYVLKPFGRPRFLTALERSRQVLQMRDSAAALERARAALMASGAAQPIDRVFVREGNAVLPVALSEVERIEAQDDYAMLVTPRRRYLVGLRMAQFEERLPNPPFLRVHRSHIVNLDAVDRMIGLDDSRFEVRMKNGAQIPVSRARSQEIRRLSR
jgi:two-component system LytT family response regulator